LKSLDVKINSSFISKSEILRDAKLEQATTKSWKEDARFQEAFNAALKPSSRLSDGPIDFLLQSSPSTEVNILDYC